MFPAPNHLFQGSFFSKGAVVSLGAFWFKYKPRLFTYSNRLKPRINRSISILRLTSLQSLTKSLCVSISYFSKSGLSTESEAETAWSLYLLYLYICYLFWWRIQHRAKQLHRRAPGAQKRQHSPRCPVNALPSHGDTLTSWMVPKKKAVATSVSRGSLPICSCNFPFSSEDYYISKPGM